jgi:hypothetical protein
MSITQTKLLVDYKDVIQRMQVNGDLQGAAETIQSAIRGAQVHLEAVLDTVFAKQEVDAVFYVDSEAFSGIQPGGQYRLELPTGFVRTDVPPVITVGSKYNLSDQLPLDPSTYRFDLIRGYLLIQASTRRPTNGIGSFNGAENQLSFVDDMYVRVQYQSGFTGVLQDTDDSPPTQKVAAEAIPDWLYEAILSYVPVIFDSSQVTNRNAEASAQYRKAGDHAIAAVAAYVRNKGMSFRATSYTANAI